MNDIDFYNGEYFEHHGMHNGVDYWIISYGYHPLAYVKANQIEFRDKAYLEKLKCHGEITFKGVTTFSDDISFVIGWDYSHYNLKDYSTLYAKWLNLDESKFKRWTFSEIEKEVIDFIDKLGGKK